jgi:hypothetical protein
MTGVRGMAEVRMAVEARIAGGASVAAESRVASGVCVKPEAHAIPRLSFRA